MSSFIVTTTQNQSQISTVPNIYFEMIEDKDYLLPGYNVGETVYDAGWQDYRPQSVTAGKNSRELIAWKLWPHIQENSAQPEYTIPPENLLMMNHPGFKLVTQTEEVEGSWQNPTKLWRHAKLPYFPNENGIITEHQYTHGDWTTTFQGRYGLQFQSGLYNPNSTYGGNPTLPINAHVGTESTKCQNTQTGIPTMGLSQTNIHEPDTSPSTEEPEPEKEPSPDPCPKACSSDSAPETSKKKKRKRVSATKIKRKMYSTNRSFGFDLPNNNPWLNADGTVTVDNLQYNTYGGCSKHMITGANVQNIPPHRVMVRAIDPPESDAAVKWIIYVNYWIKVDFMENVLGYYPIDAFNKYERA